MDMGGSRTSILTFWLNSLRFTASALRSCLFEMGFHRTQIIVETHARLLDPWDDVLVRRLAFRIERRLLHLDVADLRVEIREVASSSMAKTSSIVLGMHGIMT